MKPSQWHRLSYGWSRMFTIRSRYAAGTRTTQIIRRTVTEAVPAKPSVSPAQPIRTPQQMPTSMG